MRGQRGRSRRLPRETVGSPCSILWSVARVVKARSAMSSVGIDRRRRAARMSSPNLRKARLTGSGRVAEARLVMRNIPNTVECNTAYNVYHRNSLSQGTACQKLCDAIKLKGTEVRIFRSSGNRRAGP